MIHHGDALEILRGMDSCSIDAVVTDPPYGLSNFTAKDVAACLRAWIKGERYQHDQGGLLGAEWDSWVPGPEIWREVFRVLKPGGHAMVFAGTRTMDLMSMAMRMGGLELRDSIGWCHDSGQAPLMAWVYKTGFPKGVDVAKSIDKARTEDIEPIREVCRFLRASMDRKGLRSRMMVEHFGNCNPRLIDHWAARDTDSQPALPGWAQWLKLKEVLDLDSSMDEQVKRLNERKRQPGDAWTEADVVGSYASSPGGMAGGRFKRRDNLIRQHSEAASPWQGWNTALKPAWEPIILARKPLIGTVVENVLTHGVGAINVDGCRVAYEDTPNPATNPLYRVQNGYKTKVGTDSGGSSFKLKPNGGEVTANTLGRWPANVIIDGSEEVLAAFDAYGERKTTYVAPHHKNQRGGDFLGDLGHPGVQGYNDTGTASRFFFSAKADRTDRAGSSHPTVKPVGLMRWLCRLAVPPGGVVLDPFAGSGTTGEAAMLEGMTPVLIEREAQYVADIERRMASLSSSSPDTHSPSSPFPPS